jgi:hypothetical protein
MLLNDTINKNRFSYPFLLPQLSFLSTLLSARVWVPQFHLPPSHYTRTGVLRSTLCSDTPRHNISLFGIICILQTLVGYVSQRPHNTTLNIDSQVGNKQLTSHTFVMHWSCTGVESGAFSFSLARVNDHHDIT